MISLSIRRKIMGIAVVLINAIAYGPQELLKLRSADTFISVKALALTEQEDLLWEQSGLEQSWTYGFI